jgi:hypothetical protein
MSRTVVEVSVGTMVGGELRQATAEMEVPEGIGWEAAADLAAALGAAYARLWNVPPASVHASATLVQTERKVVHHGDVRCHGRTLRG